MMSLLLISGCTSDQDEAGNNIDTNDGTTDQNDTEPEDCGNEVGNGLEIVRGPLEPDRPADRDSDFRSLAVDPLDSNIV